MSFHIVTFRQIQALLLDTDIFLNWILMNNVFVYAPANNLQIKVKPTVQS